MENSSDIRKEITVAAYLDNKLIATRHVKKNDQSIHWESFKIDLAQNRDSAELLFKIAGTGYSTRCRFAMKQITSKTWMHVNLNEVLFKKGYQLPGRTLDKDTIVEANFYCELTDQLR